MNKENKKESIYNFFENPKGFWAYFVQIVIFILIIASVGIVVAEFFYHELFRRYEQLFHITNYIILGVFTVEYLLRLITASSKWKFAKKPMNIIDFLAVAPNYVELLLPFFIETTELRVLRIIRLLRFMRVLRMMRLFKYTSFLKRIFQYQNTILEAITPILLIFIFMKTIVWGLETFDLWINIPGLGELFAIIGFALGIILSQKISATYDKFLQVEEGTIRLYGTLNSLREILNNQKKNLGTQIIKDWAGSFLNILKDPKADNFRINKDNIKLYQTIFQVEKTPSELAILHGEICKDAAFCLSKKNRLTPKAYDTLLHQATILYLALIAVFIPGISGMISVFVATYILYGMYNITQDLDSIIGGEFNLMNIDLGELEELADS